MSAIPITELKPEYDIIFAGGGATGCLAAGRLAAAAPHLNILVLEAGPHTKDMPGHIQPGRFLTHLLPTSTTMQFNVAKPTEHVAGRAIVVPSGHCVGGGSSVNFTLYSRPAASDFDDWETKYGNVGWGSKDIIPLLRKAETYEIGPGEPTHGYSGPLKVSYGGAFCDIGKQFLDIGSKYEKHRGVADEANALDTKSVNVFCRWPKWIEGKTGKRSDVPHHFIYNQEHNENLHILDKSLVRRVIFENNRAVGVEFLNDKLIRPDAKNGVHSIRASRLVVISAGAFGSPGVLERSGIGATTILKNAGVENIVDLPGVGENYQDHALSIAPYFADSACETYDPLLRGEPDEWKKQLTQWAKDGQGLMGSNAVDAGIKMRPYENELTDLGPDFEARWKEYFADKPDKPLFFCHALAGFPADQSSLPPARYISGAVFLGYPESRGSVHITSDKVDAAPDFDAGFLKKLSDVAALRWGYKKSREIIRRLPLFRGALLPVHPVFPEGSAAALTETSPVDISAPDVVYTVEDDKAIDDFHRKFITTAWHSSGTCAMKPREQGGVVDARLNVYGVHGLKVADLSILPSNVHSNTYSTAIAIGEKSALIVAEELGIDGI